MLETIKDIEVIKSDYNSGFSRGNNLALKKAKGKYSILLNNDTELKNNALKILYNFMESHPNAGAVGPQLFSFQVRSNTHTALSEAHFIVLVGNFFQNYPN